MDQSILRYANVDVINLLRYAEAEAPAEDKNNETKNRRGGNLIYWA